jgi:hypothetical protein
MQCLRSRALSPVDLTRHFAGHLIANCEPGRVVLGTVWDHFAHDRSDEFLRPRTAVRSRDDAQALETLASLPSGSGARLKGLIRTRLATVRGAT